MNQSVSDKRMMVNIVPKHFNSVDWFIRYSPNKSELWIEVLVWHWIYYWVPQHCSSTCFILAPFSLNLQVEETKVSTFVFLDLSFLLSLFLLPLVLWFYISLTTQLPPHYHFLSLSLSLINNLSAWLHRSPWAEPASWLSQGKEK